MTIPRSVIRNDEKSIADARRPLNEAFRSLSDEIRAIPRRAQAWVRITMPVGSAGQLIRAPDFPVAAVLVLAAVNAGSATSAVSGAPWLTVEPIEGNDAQLRINSTYGILTSGVIDLLVEFVENIAPPWARSNVTGGQE